MLSSEAPSASIASRPAFVTLRNAPLKWDRMNSLSSCFYQIEKRIIFRGEAGQVFADLPVGLSGRSELALECGRMVAFERSSCIRGIVIGMPRAISPATLTSNLFEKIRGARARGAGAAGANSSKNADGGSL